MSVERTCRPISASEELRKRLGRLPWARNSSDGPRAEGQLTAIKSTEADSRHAVHPAEQ